ncbi:glucosamine-1-phosphate N-acetyltransferase [Halosimplex carlsbadense 2-9-1]|uniref:Bifunctional protein GlmU n=1 Tax=Halosimplex carlsbadense 2-9-1 TaxID=797114 RepID=M0CLR7_9EURY|nr:sugar phosphate nucleotidyltransferase [Halosimplex carlsbadense]ELZ24220.1 glucosamine-1-phosphate N-acetyltransferase [Halosimplex carlsbadense 2-9-1]
MRTVILAAGRGGRLGPLTEMRPKPMLPVANRPILESVVEAAVDAGADEILLVVGYRHDRIQDHFGDGDDWDATVRYVVQDHQIGAAHALSLAASAVDGPFVALHGDRPVDPALIERLVERYERSERPSVAAARSQRPTEYGSVELDGESVVGVSAEPTDDPPFLVNAGAYVFDERVFDAVEAADPDARSHLDLGMATALQSLADDGLLTAVVDGGDVRDVTYPWDLLSANAARLRDGGSTGVPEGVHATASVSGDTALAESVSVGSHTSVLAGTALGPNVRVGSNVTLSNCIVMAGAEIGHGAALSDCVVGESVSVGPNATVEGGEADVVVDGRVHDDVRLGGVLGDRTTLRGNVTVLPGTVVGCDVRADAGTVLDGRIDSRDTVRRG